MTSRRESLRSIPSATAERFPVPVPGPPRRLRAPRVADDRLRNGLRVLVVRKPTVPRVELRLLIPLGSPRNPAAERVLAKTLTSGTSSRSSAEIAEELQRLGGSFSVAITADHLVVSGSVLATRLSGRLRTFTELFGELLVDSRFPADEVALERNRLAQEVQIARSQPQVVAQEALVRRLYGRHPYGTTLPEPSALQRVGRASLQRLATNRLSLRGSVLVVVGDVQPPAALELLDEALAVWRARARRSALPEPPPIRTGPTVVVDRPGSVQTNIRMAGPALSIAHPDAYALELANTIFGGYFVSRFVENLRERKGYTYSPHSQLAHRVRSSFFQVAADVGTEVTAPALLETRYELGRMAALDVEPDELESAKRYRMGLVSLRIQSQAGLASVLATLVAHGLDVTYLREYPQRVGEVRASAVREASVRFLAPSRLVTVLVGDAERLERDLEPFETVKVADGSRS